MITDCREPRLGVAGWALGLGLTMLLSQAAGCIIVHDDDDEGSDIYASLRVSWELDGGCGADGRRVEMVADNGAGALCDLTADDDIDGTWCERWDCTARAQHTTLPAIRDDYDVWINVLDDRGDRIASSTAVIVDTRRAGDLFTVPTFKFPTYAGFMQLSWTLSDKSSGAALSCEDAGVAFVRVSADPDGGGELLEQDWECDAETGLSAAMPLGIYQVTVQALDADKNFAMAEEDVVLFEDQMINYGNDLVDLGAVELPIPPVQ